MTREFTHPCLGRVIYAVKSTARRFTARWKPDGLHLTVPPWSTRADINDALTRMSPALLKRKPQQTLYAIGKVFSFELLEISITQGAHDDTRCRLHNCGCNRFEISVGRQCRMDDAAAIDAISRLIKGIARYVAQSVLIQEAETTALAAGVKPNQWLLSSGRRVLGKCDGRRRISLSVTNVFLPRHLRDYIVFHELAHLTEMNHSMRFHALCNRYCNGNERILAQELKKFIFPLP